MKKKFICFITILFLLITQICFVFADSLDFYYNSSLTYNNMQNYTSYLTTLGDVKYGTAYDDMNPFYVFSCPSSFDSSQTNFVVVSKATHTSAVASYIDNSHKWMMNINRTNSTYPGIYYQNATFPESTMRSGSYFDSLEAGLSSAYSYYFNVDYSYPQNLEVGNIIYYDLGSNYNFDISLKSYFNEKSGFFSGTWTTDNRRYGFSDTLPDTNVSIGSSSGSGILWTETTPKDVSGRSHYGIGNISGTTSGRYLWIINPLYNENYYNDSLSASSLNGLLTIEDGIPVGTKVYTYSVAQNNSVIGLESTFLSSVGGTGTTSTGSAVAWTNTSTGAIYNQNIGGDNSPPSEVSASEGIRQTLEQLTRSITDIFTAPITYIHNLLGIGSDFLHNISGVWSWLPDPFPTIVITGLTVVLAIGILHTLL